MNLVLAHCGKEWRAQRGLLVAYSLLVFVCLCLGFSLVPDDWWLQEGRSPTALAWFLAAGAIGVILFAAPNLVRAEYGTKDDQFVRRLPGALGPSFGGKLLFLLLCSAALPLAGLCCGELFLQASGHPWHELLVELYDGHYTLQWPWPAVGCAYAMLLATWVWAIGTWLPGGRMAVGGVCLFVLLLGIAIYAALGPSPGIEKGIAWQGWLWAVAPGGAIVAGLSWIKGRRGGGAGRSARFGIIATVLWLVPPSLWLADQTWDYHHPDLQQLSKLQVEGLSPDGRFALARGAAHEDFTCVSIRIDLETGAAEQLTGIDRAFGAEIVRPHPGRHGGRLRYWREYGGSGTVHRVLDLTTGERTEVGYDAKSHELVLPAQLRSKVFAEARATTTLRTQDGRRVWGEDGELCFEEADGTVSRQAWPKDWRSYFVPAGHGFHIYPQGLFDFFDRRMRDAKQTAYSGFLVRGVRVFHGNEAPGPWQQQDVGAEVRPCQALVGGQVLGLFDDDQLLCARLLRKKGTSPRLFLYRPADGTTTELRVPDGVQFDSVGRAAPFDSGHGGSLLERDPAGRIWLRCSQSMEETFVLLDTATRELTPVLPRSRCRSVWYQLLDWPDAHSVLMQDDAQIVRIDIATGERTVLFPRSTP